jgi:membrane-associated PAP2 superfamily phosphatase
MHPTTQSNDTPLSSSRATGADDSGSGTRSIAARAFVALTLMFQWLPIDVTVARDWAYDTTHGRWLGHGHWWAEGLIHTDGRIAILLVIAGLLVTLVLSLKVARLRTWRSTTAYLLAAILLGWGLVGGLKEVTNVPCPWSLQGFGGERPHVGLFDARPPDFGPAKCFPGAHSGSGFALFAFSPSLLAIAVHDAHCSRLRSPRRSRIRLSDRGARRAFPLCTT